MNVFISYSVHDTGLVRAVADSISAKAVVRYWDQSKQPGAEVWPSIFEWIDSADLVLVVITGKTLTRAFSVGQEVGHARKAGKRIVPLVAEGVESADLGFLSGITYVPFNPQDPAQALQMLQNQVAQIADDIQKQKEGMVALAAGVALLFLLFGKE